MMSSTNQTACTIQNKVQYHDAMANQMSYQKQAAPFQSMVKSVDGGAFSNPMMNGMQSFQNPLVPQAGSGQATGFNPMELFWWLQNSQGIGNGSPAGQPYIPNTFAQKGK